MASPFLRRLTADYGYVSKETRRSVYLPVFRNALPEIFEAFDFADASVVVGVRNTSTVAPQALFLMNHPFVREQAAAAARRLLEETKTGARADEAGIARAYQATLGRTPTPEELCRSQQTSALEFGSGKGVDRSVSRVICLGGFPLHQLKRTEKISRPRPFRHPMNTL